MLHRYSERVSKVGRKRQLLIVAGAFLVAFVLNPQPAHALNDDVLNLEPSKITILAQQDAKIVELKTVSETKKDQIEEKKAKVEEVKKEVEVVVATKQTVQSQLQAADAEIEALKARIAEKKARLAEEARIAALRIVKIGSYAPDASGNGYDAGNCTWYVKSRRPDIGNQWGNANAWIASAQSNGFKTGKQSKKGAIGVSYEGYYGHVVYIEEWYANGTVLVSEMNWQGLYVTSSRIANETDFDYIYAK